MRLISKYWIIFFNLVVFIAYMMILRTPAKADPSIFAYAFITFIPLLIHASLNGLLAALFYQNTKVCRQFVISSVLILLIGFSLCISYS